MTGYIYIYKDDCVGDGCRFCRRSCWEAGRGEVVLDVSGSDAHIKQMSSSTHGWLRGDTRSRTD